MLLAFLLYKNHLKKMWLRMCKTCGCGEKDKKHPKYGKGPKVSKSALDYLRTEALLSLSKGEGPGHPFRGNQYTEGKSGGGKAQNSASKRARQEARYEQRVKAFNASKDTSSPNDRLRSDGSPKVTSKKSTTMKYYGSENEVTGSVMMSNQNPRKGSKVVVRVKAMADIRFEKLYGGTIISVDNDKRTVEFETEATGSRGFYTDSLSFDDVVGEIGSVDRIHNDVEDMDPISRAEHERDNR